MFVCICRRSRCRRRRARWRAVLRASEQGPVLWPRTRRAVLQSGPPRRLWRRQVQSHPLMHAFVLVFINTTYWHVLQNCICFACWKHGWIATPWFVITIPWPPRLMSECVWTLIAARTFRTLNTTCFIKKMCACVGRDKSGKFWKMSLDGMDGISVWIAEWCARTCVVEQGREISILSQLRTELVCHLT